MIGLKHNLYQIKFAHCGVICAAVVALLAPGADAAVVSRAAPTETSARVSTRGTVGARMPTTSVSSSGVTSTDTSTTTPETQPEPTPEPEPEPEPEVVIEDKTSQFDDYLSYTTESSDASSERLADLIASQRAELDALDAIAAATTTTSGNQSACDVELRSCMREKCGNDFTECAGDTDTLWGTKLNSCRNSINANCTGTAFSKFAAEIKADRDFNAEMAYYENILDCGNTYNDCIITECGTTFSKCLGKAAGDAAIAKCKTIAENCREQDSGLASRAMQVFANLRVDAEEQVKRDEERLYELRDDMMNQCQMLGATFDERTFSCVFTVEFYASDSTTLFASKKAYAGGVFDCTPNWFGIDVTTFMENAYRATREQSSATSGFMGAGIGVAAGAITSGAIDRAIDRTKAENAVRKAEKEHEKNYGDNGDTKQSDDGDKKQDDGDKKSQAQLNCEKSGGTWTGKICSNPDCGEGQIWDDLSGQCKEDTSSKDFKPKAITEQEQIKCKMTGGTVGNDGSCMCSGGKKYDTNRGCVCPPNTTLGDDGNCKLNLNTSMSSSTGTNPLGVSTRGLSFR